jgi:hypothetical protein
MKPALLAGAAALFLASSAAAQPSTSSDREASAARKLAGTSLVTMSRNSERTWQLLHAARARHDAPAATCLDAALSRTDVALRTARDEAKGADAAWRAADVVHARVAMNRIESSLAASIDAAHVADACVAHGADAPQTTERTTIDVHVPAGLPPGVTDFPR